MIKFITKFALVALLASSLAGFTTSSYAADFDWDELERVFDKPLADKLVDDNRSRRIDIDPPKRIKKKTMRYSLDYAVSKVRRQYKGKVIGARTSWRGDEAIHKVKLKTEDGRIRTIFVSGTSGR